VQDGALDANFEFDLDFPSQIEAGQGQGPMSQTPFTNLFTDNFPPANPNDFFCSNMPVQEYDFPHSIETPDVPSTIPETDTSSNDYDQPAHHNPYSVYVPGQEIALSNFLETNFYEPSFSQETSFSSTSTSASASNGYYDNYNQSDIFAGPEQEPSSEFETNHPDNQATQLTTPSTPSMQVLHTSPSSNPASPSLSSSSPISPDRHTCPHCPRTFKRPGDVKRHEKMHIPGQRRFHCWKVGCERKGWRGFYRRDKLRDHVKTVHGS
jgi:hypothetical protein